jgi:arylsulfatase
VRRNLKKGNLTLQIYDLESDPGEQNDLAPTNPALVERMTRLLAEARRPSPIFPIPALDTE